MISKKYAVPNEKRCVACGACVKVCPRKAIEIWKGCFAKVHTDLCVGCGLCTKECPAGCIEIVEREEKYDDEK
ncbi:MAG: 4Fe-4S binding protein [Lachnospira sp.]|nr:4Fe-4S binding protein [Lachnospira sp.]